MKKSNIIILVFIAAAIAVVISSFGEFSTYETFESATRKEGQTFHIVGYLDTSRQQEYDPIKDANLFTFFAKDKNDEVHKVIFAGTKPQDFERSEQLVMTGFMKDGNFHCAKIQMKCPSKYEEDQIAVATEPSGA